MRLFNFTSSVKLHPVGMSDIEILEDMFPFVNTEAVSYEETFPRNFGIGGFKKIPWKISSGAQSEDLGPSLRQKKCRMDTTQFGLVGFFQFKEEIRQM